MWVIGPYLLKYETAKNITEEETNFKNEGSA